MDQFNSGKCKVLLATSVASRGIDFPHISYVINREVPRNIDDYVHRVGRTGRAGYKGTAITLVKQSQDKSCLDLHKVLKECKQEIPTWFEEICTKTRHESSGHNNNRRPSQHNNRRDSQFNNRRETQSGNDYEGFQQRRSNHNNRDFNMSGSHRNSYSDNNNHHQSFRNKREFNKRNDHDIDHDL